MRKIRFGSERREGIKLCLYVGGRNRKNRKRSNKIEPVEVPTRKLQDL